MSQVNGDTTTPNPTLFFFLGGGGVELSALNKTMTKIGVACVSDWS